nr:hypothetical protein [Roseovarius sp.]
VRAALGFLWLDRLSRITTSPARNVGASCHCTLINQILRFQNQGSKRHKPFTRAHVFCEHEAPQYRFTMNDVAAILGPIWFGARGLRSWFLAFAILETFAYIQIGKGLISDLGRASRQRAEKIGEMLDLRRQQIEAAEQSGASSLDSLKRAAESLEGALAKAQATLS